MGFLLRPASAKTSCRCLAGSSRMLSTSRGGRRAREVSVMMPGMLLVSACSSGLMPRRAASRSWSHTGCPSGSKPVQTVHTALWSGDCGARWPLLCGLPELRGRDGAGSNGLAKAGSRQYGSPGKHCGCSAASCRCGKRCRLSRHPSSERSRRQMSARFSTAPLALTLPLGYAVLGYNRSCVASYSEGRQSRLTEQPEKTAPEQVPTQQHAGCRQGRRYCRLSSRLR